MADSLSLHLTDQHEHEGEHHVFHRTPIRDGVEGQTQRLRAQDATRYHQGRRRRVPGKRIRRSKCEGRSQGTVLIPPAEAAGYMD